MSSDDAAWRELIAQYDLPASAEPDAVPWPERENLGSPEASLLPQGPAQPSPEKTDTTCETELPQSADADSAPAGSDSASTGRAGSGSAGPGSAGPDQRNPAQGSDVTRVIRPASPVWRPATDAAEEEDDRYIPPPPPPLPRLDSVAKGAWVALVGGPLYLLLATFLGWQVSGVAALIAVAAFVGGFAVMVFRMGDGPSRGDGPDNGAVV